MNAVTIPAIERMIYVIRGQKVILDSDLAELYEVETRAFNQAVKRNQIIGYVSTTGSHCKPQTCLHWGLIVEKRYLNPLSILTKPYPILLPILFD